MIRTAMASVKRTVRNYPLRSSTKQAPLLMITWLFYICDQLGKIGIELTPQSAQMMDWYAMITTGEYGLTLFKTQGGFYDPGNTIGNIDPSMAMDPIISQVAAYLPGGADLITELESTTDEETNPRDLLELF